MPSKNRRLFLSALSSVDNFGRVYAFSHHGRSRIASLFGVVLTILAGALGLIYVGHKINNLIDHQDPDILFNKKLSITYTRVDLEESDFMLSFAVRINGSLIQPSKIPLYVIPRPFKQGSFPGVQNTNDFSLFPSVYNLTVTPCATHRKSQKLKSMIKQESFLEKVVFNYSLCLERNLSQIAENNRSFLTTVGGGIQNLPIEYIQILFANCSKVLNPNCIGIASADKAEIQISYPQVKYKLDDREEPLRYEYTSFRPILVFPSITKYYGVYLANVKIYDEDNPFQERRLVSTLPQIERQVNFPGNIPGIMVSLLFRAERHEISITRKYYNLMNLNSDFGSMIETIVIIAILVSSFGNNKNYHKTMTSILIDLQNNPKPSQNCSNMTEVNTCNQLSRSYNIINKSLLKRHQTVLLKALISLAVVGEARNNIESSTNKKGSNQGHFKNSDIEFKSKKNSIRILSKVAPKKPIPTKD